jgi:uncharacterized membrane protein
MRSWLSLLVVVGACGGDATPDDVPGPPDEETCRTSYVDYGNFGEPFALDWCRGCHSSALPADMRQNAPAEVNFDTHEDVLAWKDRILIRAAGAQPTMPPAGGPSAAERALLAEWLGCGGR